jgi:hypothetical protein
MWMLVDGVESYCVGLSFRFSRLTPAERCPSHHLQRQPFPSTLRPNIILTVPQIYITATA